MATRQTSTSGKPKSPRIQVVLPEELCAQLSAVAEAESRTVSNMAKVLIQQGLERIHRETPGRQSAPERGRSTIRQATDRLNTDAFREALEERSLERPSRLRGVPRRLRLQRPGPSPER
ncbi:ribbon-helix-helix domain-containing protein [Cyanobium sp. ATX 6F1]|uniref:ribbon-helix-helix domain-containing protein n=1 Tax=unclassified Cyanobium TaxID=2627006 RepID=UPI0020CCC387|nr:hypothetical protein [Cyanobium sp. ATX 6F1]MCP9917408.1 hypothetical protein [Cyanobium sp. ATX 6F1]